MSKRVTVLPGGWGCVQSLTSQEGWGEPPGVELGALVREGCRMLVVCGDSGTWGGCELCRTVPAPGLRGFLG